MTCENLGTVTSSQSIKALTRKKPVGCMHELSGAITVRCEIG